MKKKSKIYYAGFVDGKIFKMGGAIYVYTTKRRGNKSFRDVRPVQIVEVKK